MKQEIGVKRVVGEKEKVGKFTAELLPYFENDEDFGEYDAFGYSYNGELIAGFVYNRFTGRDVHVSAVSVTPIWVTKANMGFILSVGFDIMKVERISSLTSKSNKRARKLLEGLGFKLEGMIREGNPDDTDICCYGILKREARRWLDYAKEKK